jgi:putative acetyltransferase
MEYTIREIKSEDNFAIAELIRYNLKNHGLDIPGTVYFDSVLDDLCEAYSFGERQGYYIFTDESNMVLGGIGFAEFAPFENCAELQKLYLADSVKGNGFGYKLIEFIESKMLEAGYKASYLETHSNLKAAIHIYEKSGYEKIDRPKDVAHGAMDNFYYKKLTCDQD